MFMKKKSHLLFYRLLTILILLGFGYTQAPAASDEGTAKIIEGAKKEGRLLIYSSLNIADMQRMKEAFQIEHPFINVDYVRTGGQSILNKTLNEARAKKYLPDVIQLGTFELFYIKKEGLLAKYLSPEREAYRENYKDAEGYITTFFQSTKPIAYNTKLVSPHEVPKSYEDLLDPRWVKKMSFVRESGGTGVRWFMSMMKKMGDKKGEEFMRKLVNQKLIYLSQSALENQLLAAAEIHIAIVGTGHLIESSKDQGAAMDWVRTDPMITSHTGISLLAHAPHPHSGKLFVDFMLSKKGQELLRRMHRIPARSDVEPDPPRLVKGINLFPYKPEWAEEYTKYSKQFYEIFR